MGNGIPFFAEIHSIIPRQPPNEDVEAVRCSSRCVAAGENSYRSAVVKALALPAARLWALDHVTC